VDLIERKAFSLMDALSQTGGIYGVVNILCLSLGSFLKNA
jgi:hypothetical protein